MKARDFNGTIKTYYQLPKSFGNVIGGFDTLTDSELQGHGFYDVVTPSYDRNTQELGDIYFDSANSRFTYPVNDKTWEKSLNDLKSDYIKIAKERANQELQKTDWYVTRKYENGTAIPSNIQKNRNAIRTACVNHENEIISKTTKAQVVSYDITY